MFLQAVFSLLCFASEYFTMILLFVWMQMNELCTMVLWEDKLMVSCQVFGNDISHHYLFVAP